MVKGGSPPKKRHMRSLPPFALHLQYAPTSGSDWKRSCGITPPLPPDGNLPKTTFAWYMSMVRPSDDSAVNPGIFISQLLSFSGLTVTATRPNAAPRNPGDAFPGLNFVPSGLKLTTTPRDVGPDPTPRDGAGSDFLLHYSSRRSRTLGTPPGDDLHSERSCQEFHHSSRKKGLQEQHCQPVSRRTAHEGNPHCYMKWCYGVRRLPR